LQNNSKINQLFSAWPKNVVYLTSWLKEKGYSTQLLNRYKKSNWITSLGNGAVIKNGDQPSVEGAIFALQKQAKMDIHPGGKTALVLLGKAQYLEFKRQSFVLFGNRTEKLPKWMAMHQWMEDLNYFSSTFLPMNLGMVEKEMEGFTILISGATRAMMECLYLSTNDEDLLECYEIMEGLNNLRPKQVQDMLVQCTNIKVKRLFLYLAKKVNHAWYNSLELNKIDLGSGKRKLTAHGVYIPEFRITVPKKLADG
jgi:hypothetical protein